ncbi:MAG: hypothetical protein IPF83_07575 [Rhodanobacteraceae bacterium]|nr:hypothetical protein [Rhodanobacteraceae bacterium]MBP9155168.1 hypothetical protein [Xanthomonadales bacterium]HQW80975.1 hypothetical protein [Pseudomonadota bacterium]
MRTARLFTLSLALIVAACASAPPKRINPPAVSIQRLVMQASGAYAIELRLQNHSDVPMHFAGINLQLRVAGIDAGRLRTQPDIDVSPHNAEIVHLRLSADKSVAEPLSAIELADDAPDRVLEGEFEYENQNGDWVKVPIDATRRGEIEQVLADKNNTAVHYMLRGTVDISEPKRSYDIVFESRLSPVPGKPGEFR